MPSPRGTPRAPSGHPRVCVACGVTFRKPPSQASDYCSRQCRWPGVRRSCRYCGAFFRVPPSHVVTEESCHYCTVECRKLHTAQKNAAPLTLAVVRHFLDYDAATGDFYWRVSPIGRIPAGSLAGYPNHKGYWLITIQGEEYAAHRLAWLWMTGAWPKDQIDHKDRNKANNAWHNLREATNSQNIMNRQRESFWKNGTSARNPYRGVQLHPCGRYQVWLGGKHVGMFATAEEGRDAYLKAARQKYGEFFAED